MKTAILNKNTPPTTEAEPSVESLKAADRAVQSHIMSKQQSRNLLQVLQHFFVSIYQYRYYLTQSVARDLRRKYKRSSLGYLWSMLNPLLTMAVMTVVFSKLLPRVENYSVFLFSALIGWQYFNATVSSSTGAVLGNMRIVEQVPVPKFLFVISNACSSIVNFLLALVPLILVMLIVGQKIPVTILLVPIVMIPIVIMTLAMSMLVAIGTVFYDDVKHLSGVIMSAWYYLTPIIYGPELLPPHLVKWLQLNPLFFAIDNLRAVIYRGELPNVTFFLFSLGFGCIMLMLSLFIFEKADDKFVYFA